MTETRSYPPTIIPTIIAICMLLGTVPKFFPYGYYTLLRFVVCGTGAYVAYWLLVEEKRHIGFLSILIAVLFNPFIPIYLYKELWIGIDLLVAIFLALRFLF